LEGSGELTPHTKLQTFFFGIGIAGIGIDPKPHIDLVLSYFDPLDQRPHEVALARPVGPLQLVVQHGGKVPQPAKNELQFPLPGGLLGQRLALLLQLAGFRAMQADLKQG
jgi:hypothetical protein